MTPEQRAKLLAARLAFTPPIYFEAVLASTIREAEQAISKYWEMTVGQERDELRAENDKLRAFLAYSQDPCIYCGLPAADLAKCAHGFPGCGRADDMSLFENPWGKKTNEGH